MWRWECEGLGYCEWVVGEFVAKFVRIYVRGVRGVLEFGGWKRYVFDGVMG